MFSIWKNFGRLYSYIYNGEIIIESQHMAIMGAKRGGPAGEVLSGATSPATYEGHGQIINWRKGPLVP